MINEIYVYSFIMCVILVLCVFKILMYMVNIILRLFKNCNLKDEVGKNFEYNRKVLSRI